MTATTNLLTDYQTYIFDLDGTLLDSLEDLWLSCNYALRCHGYPGHTIDEVRLFVGNGVAKLIERALPDGTGNPSFEDVLSTFRQHYSAHSLDHTKPYPGIVAMLKELRRRGKRLAVVSNKFHAATQKLVAHYFGDVIDVAVGEDASRGLHGKPSPHIVEEALHRLMVSKAGAVYVGDSEVDIATARNSGLPCISVLWGFRGQSFLEEHGATTFVSSPGQMIINHR